MYKHEPMGGGYYDDDDYVGDLRRGFVKKVYGILASTLSFTVLLCILPTSSKGVQDYFRDNIWIVILFSILSIIPLYSLFCFQSLARRVPINYILLFSFVLCESVIVAYACAAVGDPKLVLIAALMTMGITIVLTIFACTVKIDFTICYGILFVFVGTLLLFGIFAIIFQSEVLYITYISLGILVYGMYLIIDTQLICGGKTWELTEDDYIIGALILYIDIIVLFLKILELIARAKNS